MESGLRKMENGFNEWKTHGIYQSPEFNGEAYNIHKHTNVHMLCRLYAQLLTMKKAYEEVANEVGLEDTSYKHQLLNFEDWRSDFLTRINQLKVEKDYEI